jgi:hypothetical protein
MLFTVSVGSYFLLDSNALVYKRIAYSAFSRNSGNMAQGSSQKLGKKSKSLGALKKKVVRTKTVTKGRKEYQTKHINNAVVDSISTTKAINRKNELQVAAKAVSVGTQFFMSDIKNNGQKEYRQQLQKRDKKQIKSSSAQQSQRVQEQIRKLGRNTSK